MLFEFSFLIGTFLKTITNDTPIYVITFSVCSLLAFSPLENKGSVNF